jgi:hypothetical protein
MGVQLFTAIQIGFFVDGRLRHGYEAFDTVTIPKYKKLIGLYLQSPFI